MRERTPAALIMFPAPSNVLPKPDRVLTDIAGYVAGRSPICAGLHTTPMSEFIDLFVI